MSIFDKLKQTALLELVQDPRLKHLLTRREFRLSQEELHHEFVKQAAGEEELQDLALTVGEGFLELSGRVKKRLLPFAIPFSARFSLHSLEFSPRSKAVHLKLEELKPFELDSLTKKLVEKVPFLSFADGLVTVHLARVPRLTGLFACQIKGFRPFDHIVLKELDFREGEVVGRVGVLL
ncbi:MAG TPA: hypothetical protein VK187_06640 [Geobacteraceae bacterium]|nr:hypothetical protein [Geobacteraceae bacterium]